jgi:hypothetical protein
MGYVAYQTPRSGDHGVDVFIESHDTLASGRIVISAKRYNSTVGPTTSAIASSAAKEPSMASSSVPGSISVVQQLLAAGLVDELRLLVHPVAAHKGRRLFDDGDEPYHLKVTATEAFPPGVIRVIYTHRGIHQGLLRRGQGPGAGWEVAASVIRGRCPSRPARR